MKKYRFGTALVLTAIITTLGLSACGNANSITSLTDSDSAAETLEPVVSEAAEPVVSGTVSAPEQAADTLPEIAAQTIEKPAGTVPDTQTAPDTSAPSEEDDDEEDENENENEEFVGVEDASVPEDQHETESSDSQDSENMETGENEEHEDPAELDETDEIDITETDEGGPHGEGNTATVTAASANVRSDPYVDDEDDNVIGVLYEGDVVTVLGNEDGWYHISFEGGSGYVSASLFE